MRTRDMTPEKQEAVDRGWLRAAMVFGETNSKEVGRRVGACAVDESNRLVSFGYNGFPPGVPDTPETWANSELKNAIVQHAEVNAVTKATFSLAHGTLYCPWRPCHACLGHAATAGVSRVVWLEEYGEEWAHRNDTAFDIVHINTMVRCLEYRLTRVEAAIVDMFKRERAGS